MEAAIVVYVISQVEHWKEACYFVMTFSAIIAAITTSAAYLNLERIKLKHWVPYLVLCLIAGLILAVLPSKKTAEYMATAYGVQWAIQSPTGQQVIDKSGKIVNNVLDLAIQKTTPASK